MSTTNPIPPVGKSALVAGPQHRCRDRAHLGEANSLGINQPIVTMRGVQLTHTGMAPPDAHIEFLTGEPVVYG
jgi:hypothetical protein